MWLPCKCYFMDVIFTTAFVCLFLQTKYPFLVGCPGCVLGAGAGSCADAQDPDTTEGDPGMALPPSLPQDEV